LRVCYEAGPTGYGLVREFKKAGVFCVVVAPSLVATARVRFRNGKLGPALLRDKTKKALADLVTQEQFAVPKRLVAKSELIIDGTDLVASIDLGDPRALGKHLNTAMMIAAALQPRVAPPVARPIRAEPVVEKKVEKKN
jgi:hypothetical protein